MAELLTFFIILIAGLIFSEVFKRLHLPYVTALIIAGVVFGPHVLDYVGFSETMEFLSSMGVVFLMFIAGSEIKSNAMKDIKDKVAIFVALNGVIPFFVGIAIAYFMGFGFWTAIILGTIFISSSVAVIVPSLESRGLIKTSLGRSIIASTILEDVASLLLLAFILQSKNPTTPLPIYLYIPILLGVIYLLKSVVPKLEKMYHKSVAKKDIFERELRFVLVVLVASVILFELLGMHSIVAGFIVGMILSDTLKGRLSNKIRTMSYGLLIPVFFFTIGMQMDISVFASRSSLFLIGLVVFGLIISKFVSGWVAARLSGFSSRGSFLAGNSTIPQLSTSLAAAFAALEFNLLAPELISAIIVLSISTTLLAPLLIRLADHFTTPSDLE